MKYKYQVFFLFSFVLLCLVAKGQPDNGWDQEKMMGQKFFLHEHYSGSPFFTKEWTNGNVTLNSGEQISDLPLKYNGKEDELITYNELFYTMIKIEKSSVKCFRFDYKGVDYLFERRYFDGLIKGDRYFQVYHKGEVDLLCYREIQLISTSPYKDESGITKNMAYQPSFRFFLFNPKTGYHQTNLKRNSLFRLIPKEQVRRASQLIRSNHINFKLPDEFGRALSVLEENNISVVL